MNKRNGIQRLGVKASHRKAIHGNMATSVLRHGRVRTTLPKAKSVRRTVEKLITRAKVDSVHNRREVARLIRDKDILNKLFTEIAPEFNSRPGGYTRVIKTGLRRHDAAEMALIELVGHGLEEPVKRKNRRKAGREADKAAKPEIKKSSPETLEVEVDSSQEPVEPAEKEAEKTETASPKEAQEEAPEAPPAPEN